MYTSHRITYYFSQCSLYIIILEYARFFCEDDACSFFPECFNLNSLEETEEFTEQFQVPILFYNLL